MILNKEPHTISMGWRINDNFDGCVYKNETILNINNHFHINNSDHRLVFYDYRLLKIIII